MTISMYKASAPVFSRALTNLSHVLQKGEAHAKDLGVDPDGLLGQRLIFDMFPLIKQIQIACDTSARCAARLAGVEPKSFSDEEKTLAEACDRVARATEYVQGFKPEQIDGSEDREIHLPMRGGEMKFTGRDYLLGFAIPTVFFHCTTAYDILRVAGVHIGKRDFLGSQ
jgi:hypothetical protein